MRDSALGLLCLIIATSTVNHDPEGTHCGASMSDVIRLRFQQRPLAAMLGTDGTGAMMEAERTERPAECPNEEGGGREEVTVDQSPSLPGIASSHPGILHLGPRLKK